jgi:nucleoside-diphosphate-sugar epimerase
MECQTMKVSLTGATGYIGAAVAERLSTLEDVEQGSYTRDRASSSRSA